MLDAATLVLDGGRVEAVLEDPEARDAHADVLDAGGGLVFPGLVNAHTHFYSTLARGMAVADAGDDFELLLRRLWWRLDAALDLEDVEISAALAARDGLRLGVTTVFDHHASYGAIEGSLDAVARGLERAGQRGVLCYEISDRAGPDAARAALAENVRFASRLERTPYVLGAMLGLHASFTLSDATLEAAAEAARAHGLRAHVHLAEAAVDRVAGATSGSGSGVVERLERFGLLEPGILVAHAVHVDAHEMRRLGERGAVVAHNPRSNMNNGVGRCDVPALVRAGVQVGLGTDAYGAGLLSEARAATLVERQAPRLGTGGAAREALLEANPALLHTWLPGAGRLSPGSPADVVVTRYVPPTPLSGANLWGHLLFGDVEAAVQYVFVGGEVVVDGGRSTRQDDAALEAAARDRAARLWERFRAESA